MRRSGVLMPVSSLPSRFGIGGFSKEAYDFVDFLAASGQSLWQILPLGPTGYGDSPYQSFSTFAGSPYYISLDALIEEGLLTEEECLSVDFGNDTKKVDYEKIYNTRFHLLRKAFERADIHKQSEYMEFVEENRQWLKDYAMYMAVKDSLGGASWIAWDEGIRLRKPEAMTEYEAKLADDIAFYSYQQYLFSKQWMALKEYANKKGVQIVGDIPIYVAFDSADTWANPELFQLDEENVPIAVAGCPPDAFSATGQLWGNPLYQWDYHEETGFAWWIRRLSHCFHIYDIVRIDHFRGFDAYWAIPYGDETAENGTWEKGPGYNLFAVMKKTLGNRAVIAEDLGFLTPSVLKLVKRTGYPGMKVLQFAFDADGESDYLPHNYTNNCVVYTGTHDNDTVNGWIPSMSRKDLAFAKKYLNIRRNADICESLIRTALGSVADTAIIPMQDYLGLGSEARVNTPSTLGGNWEWRMERDACTEALSSHIRELTQLYGRTAHPNTVNASEKKKTK
ncbi:MAG: 4-alpha-glucanotransferase [Lachnospiraceae bacterium]|nr:4-alpha-glucanotransferase [Lachnospiraceae bacterium]